MIYNKNVQLNLLTGTTTMNSLDEGRETWELSVFVIISQLKWVESIGSLGQQLREFPKCSVICTDLCR